MTDLLRDLLRDEADRIDIPPAPIPAIVADGQRRTRLRRTQVLIAVAACVAVIIGGWVGVNRFLGDDARDLSPDVATNSPSATATAVPGSMTVSGSGVQGQSFGAGADEVTSTVTNRLGEPDLVVEPARYSRIAGNDGWFENPDDPLSLSWQHATLSVTCWGQLCLMFGGDDADTLRLRGWEIQATPRWAPSGGITDSRSSEVRLAGTGIELGDSWKRVRAAYPDTKAGGGEGASLVIKNTPWPGVFDGVGEWRLSGQWDYTRPNYAPSGAKVTRLSGGEGPEPGCC